MPAVSKTPRPFLAALAALVTLSACSGPTATAPLIFSAGGAPAEIAVFGELVQAYNQALPEGAPRVELRALPADSDLQLQSYSAALGSGRAPFDLLRVDGVWLADFDAKGWLRPLNSLLREGAEKPFSPRALESARLRGRLLALPWNVDVGLLYSRKDLLRAVGAKAPPRSLDELRRLAQAAQVRARKQGRDLAGLLWQAKAYEGLTCNFLESYVAFGGSAQAVERAQAWEPGPALKALEHLRGLLGDGLSPANTATELAEEESRLLFQSGRAVFMRNWPYAAALLEAEGSPVKGKVWVSALPGASTLGGWHLAVRADSPRAQAAADLAVYLTSADVQLQLARRLGWNPSREDVYARLDRAGLPHLDALRQAMAQAVSRPRVAGYAAFSERSYQAVNQVLLGSLSPAQGVERLSRP